MFRTTDDPREVEFFDSWGGLGLTLDLIVNDDALVGTGASASAVSVTDGSARYSTTTSSDASRASDRVSAMTIATASPSFGFARGISRRAARRSTCEPAKRSDSRTRRS